MLPVQPDLIPTDAALDRDALAVIAFGDPLPGALASLAVPQLSEPPLAEVWRAEGAVRRGARGGIRFAAADDVLFASLSCTDADPRRAAVCVYDRLIAFVREAGYPHLLRVWNHVDDINRIDDDLERYRSFCTGRHDAFARHGYRLRGDLPAASAVGMRAPGLVTYCAASRTPAVAIENPRQVSAYDYPVRYGPRSPSFSRATMCGDVLFLSGTASIVGHETRHAGDLDAQVDETLVNIDCVLQAAGVRELSIAKIYVRRAEDAGRVRARVRDAMPRTKTIVLHADICRDALLVEIEGVGCRPGFSPAKPEVDQPG